MREVVVTGLFDQALQFDGTAPIAILLAQLSQGRLNRLAVLARTVLATWDIRSNNCKLTICFSSILALSLLS